MTVYMYLQASLACNLFLAGAILSWAGATERVRLRRLRMRWHGWRSVRCALAASEHWEDKDTRDIYLKASDRHHTRYMRLKKELKRSDP